MRICIGAGIAMSIVMAPTPAMAEGSELASSTAQAAAEAGGKRGEAAENLIETVEGVATNPGSAEVTAHETPAYDKEQAVIPAAASEMTPAPAATECFGTAGPYDPECGGSAAPVADWDLAGLPHRETATFAPKDDRADAANGDCQDYCPAELARAERRWADHIPREYATHRSFWAQAATVKTESLLLLGYFGITGGSKLFKETRPFRFKSEGWFGKDTSNVGVDKLAHAFNTYMLAEFLHNQIHHRTNASEGDAVTAAALASGLMIFSELSDAIEPGSGWAIEDVTMNLAGAGFSVLRNTVPGLKEKVAFKIEIVPNKDIYTYKGKRHFEQQRFFFSLKGAGFAGLAETPLRFVDLQVGYYGSDFRLEDRAAGREPKRHLFVGLGLNVGELLFGEAQSGFGKAAYSVLDYLQLPYTSIRYDTTGRFGY